MIVQSRFDTGPEATVSRLYWVEGEREDREELICQALEDQYQLGRKVPGETCIPSGLYGVRIVTDSPLAQRYAAKGLSWWRGLPRLLDVPGFEGISPHTGNVDDDSRGCPIVGMELEELGEKHWRIRGGTSYPAFELLCTRYIYPALLDRKEPLRWLVTDHLIERALRRAD